MKIDLQAAEKMVANLRENGCCGPFAQALVLIHTEWVKLRESFVTINPEWDGEERRR
jgi:hypothetical protein